MKCLVIIDMQWIFDAARENWLILNIVDKIKKYIERNEPIIILEYVDDGETISKILDIVRGYENCFISEKMGDDGSEEINNIIHEQDLNVSEFEVCGVNLDACVVSTVTTMAWEYPYIPVNVILDCCNSCSGKDESIKNFHDEAMGYDKKNIALVV